MIKLFSVSTEIESRKVKYIVAIFKNAELVLQK